MLTVLKKRVRSLSFNPDKELATLWLELKVLRDFLEEMTASKDPLMDIVAFFNTTSQWQDNDDKLLGKAIEVFEEANYGQFNRILSHLRTLRLHIRNSGRSEYGYNRTKPFETVTPDKVFLGNVFGLWTKTVAYWVTTRNDPRGAWEAGVWSGHPVVIKRNAFDVVSLQAEEFMSSHCRPMIWSIDQIPWVVR
jgi:hypothetical protein